MNKNSSASSLEMFRMKMTRFGFRSSSCTYVMAGYTGPSTTYRVKRKVVYIDGWMNQAYSRLSTTHGHVTDCKLKHSDHPMGKQ